MELIISFAVSGMFLIHLIKHFDYEVYSVECSTECVRAHVCVCVGVFGQCASMIRTRKH